MNTAPAADGDESAAHKPAVTPQYPGLNTQPARLLAALLSARKIDPLSGWRSLGIYRLSDTVLQLRKLGWPVVTDRLDVTNRFAEACHVALYYLPDDAIRAVGERGHEFLARAEAVESERRAA